MSYIPIIANVVVWAIALLHVYIMVLEMFLWTTPRGQKAFGMMPEFAQQTRVLAANQGLYNGFLAAGLIVGLLHQDILVGVQFQVFFLVCVAAAGFFGAITTRKMSIFFIQTVPALIGLFLAGLGVYLTFAQVVPPA
jgi:putative membrane protein